MSETKQASYRFNAKDIEWFREFCEKRKVTTAEGFSMLISLMRAKSISSETEKKKGSLILYPDAIEKIDKEIKRRSSFEDLRTMFANLWNERAYMIENNVVDKTRSEYVETMLYCLGAALSIEHLKDAGWHLTDKERWTPKKIDV